MTTPPPDPLSYVLDKLYIAQTRVTDYVNKQAHQMSDNDYVRATADWIASKKDLPLSKGDVQPYLDDLRHLQDKVRGALSTVKDASVGRMSTVMAPPPPPPTATERVTTWLAEHKLLAGLIVFGATGSAFIGVHMHQQRALAKRRRRRARKTANGNRTEVVVLITYPREPISKIITNELERRGYIVYVTTPPGEEHLVLKEGSSDIRPLILPSASSLEISGVLDKFANLVDKPQRLAAVIVLPDLYYPTGPIESVNVAAWSDTMFTKVVNPIALLSQGFIPLARKHQAKFIMLTPSILPSLRPPFHAPECVATAALQAFATCLQRELAPQNIPFVNMRLGSFNIAPSALSVSPSGLDSPLATPSDSTTSASSSISHHSRSYAPMTMSGKLATSAIRADVFSWPDHLRLIYGKAYASVTRAIYGTKYAYQSTGVRPPTGSPLRELNLAILDVLVADNSASLSKTVFVGKGSRTYYLLGGILPDRTVSWLLGASAAGSAPAPSSVVEEVLYAQPDVPSTPSSPLADATDPDLHPDLAASWERV
ncbi:uncharacterized protein V1510DRAFT_424857 [Dipodascopsis tothii]|uniref:uncharacterized protein n=1 Tax=Dipodascopsis tothii TaxID=44089 RepID=UPI0034CE07D7